MSDIFYIIFFLSRLLLPSVCSPLLPVRLKQVLMPVPTMDMAMVSMDIMDMAMVMDITDMVMV